MQCPCKMLKLDLFCKNINLKKNLFYKKLNVQKSNNYLDLRFCREENNRIYL